MDAGWKILRKLFENGARGGGVSEEEIALAKEQGYILDCPSHKTHEQSIAQLRQILQQIDPRDVANGFLFSLSTRRLEYRSALGSYYYGAAIGDHDLMHSHNEIPNHCYHCGWSAWQENPSEFQWKVHNLDNYTRYKYGGSPIGSISLDYVLLDLEQFLKLPKVTPTQEDRQIFAKILATVGTLDGRDKAGKLEAAIRKAKIFKCNKDEVAVLLGILGICGVLAGKDAPSYDVYFANEYERSPVEHKNDFMYPVNRWHARDGINREKLLEVFGEDFGVC